ncbi:MAG: hypothetical protein ACJ735_09805 [Actinomycetes bacterium]
MTAPTDLGPLCEVHVLQLPVAIWRNAQQHTDELLREFSLIVEQIHQEGEGGSAAPVRLLRLVDELSATYSQFSTSQEEALFAAAADGTESLDLVYEVPRSVGPAAQHLADLLDEVDDYCRAGQHLLTLAAPTEVVRFRRWFLDEFMRQADGHEATPWPQYPA